MIAIGVDVGDKINRELRSYGANIVVYPADAAMDVRIGDQQIKPASPGSHLKESDLPKIKGIFWGHNIVGFAPFLYVQADIDGRLTPVIGTYFDKSIHFGTEDFTSGVEKLYPWWRVQGKWPRETEAAAAEANSLPQLLLGSRIAEQLGKLAGSEIRLAGTKYRVTGTLSTGGAEESAVIVPLAIAQQLAHAPDAVDKVYVSALTKPEDAFARRDPQRMTAADRDRWYCSPYANSVAYQLREVFPGARAEQIRQAAQNEGTILSHISGMMLLIAVASLIAAALAVAAAMATTIAERRQEVGLMKSLGATASTIASLFVCEATLLAVGAGLLGFLLGDIIAQRVGQAVFHSPVAITPVLLPMVIFLALLVTVAGSAAAIRRALKLDPVLVLRGDV